MEKYDKKAAELIERSYQTPEIVNQRLRTLAALALTRGESVLDAGCGTGLLLEQQALAVGREGRAEGVDFSDDMLAHARARCAGLEQVHLQQGSIETLPFDDASFDAVSCTQTLLYVDDLGRALREFYRVLKPRGRIALLETDWSGAIMNSHDQALTQRVFDAWDVALVNPNLPKRLRPLLAGLGFANQRVEAIPVLNASYAENSFSANMLQNFARTAHRSNIITAGEAEQWLDGIDRLIAEDAYFFCVNRFLFTAFK
ncbi:MAG: methyltransferase domain-containing protein [Gammaproteobacteria bacterium]|nr:methyltransferase domain-containing protein [Gammaproteobacteria bacterium]MDH3534238.1 methyltransferase domain-containing protein [Gammaproteobacteria bacterium]